MQEARNMTEVNHLESKVLCKVFSISCVPLGWSGHFLAQVKKKKSTTQKLKQPY